MSSIGNNIERHAMFYYSPATRVVDNVDWHLPLLQRPKRQGHICFRAGAGKHAVLHTSLPSIQPSHLLLHPPSSLNTAHYHPFDRIQMDSGQLQERFGRSRNAYQVFDGESDQQSQSEHPQQESFHQGSSQHGHEDAHIEADVQRSLRRPHPAIQQYFTDSAQLCSFNDWRSLPEFPTGEELLRRPGEQLEPVPIVPDNKAHGAWSSKGKCNRQHSPSAETVLLTANSQKTTSKINMPSVVKKAHIIFGKPSCCSTNFSVILRPPSSPQSPISSSRAARARGYTGRWVFVSKPCDIRMLTLAEPPCRLI